MGIVGLAEGLLRNNAEVIFNCFYGNCSRALEYIGHHFCDISYSDDRIKSLALAHVSQGKWEKLRVGQSEDAYVIDRIIELATELFQEIRDGICVDSSLDSVSDCDFDACLEKLSGLHKHVLKKSLCSGKIPRDVFADIEPYLIKEFPEITDIPNYSDKASYAYETYLNALNCLQESNPQIDFKFIERLIVAKYAKAMVE